MALRQWRGSGPPADGADHQREDIFLEQHVTGGALIHKAAAAALATALDSEQDEEKRARLALRIFGEYVNALETLGGWGWAIRNRRSSRLLLDAFLSYLPGDVKDFYKIVSSHTGELSSLLRLPRTQTITDAFRRRGIPHAPLLGDLHRVEVNLAQAAQHYFHPEELFVTAYNKTKHGAPIIRGYDLGPDEFYVVSPDPTGIKRYMDFKFSSTASATAQTLKLIEMVSNTTQALVAFARNLKGAGLLY